MEMKRHDLALQELSAQRASCQPWTGEMEKENQNLLFQLHIMRHEIGELKGYKHKYAAQRSRTQALHGNLEAKEEEIRMLRSELARARDQTEQSKLDTDKRFEQIQQAHEMKVQQMEREHARRIQQMEREHAHQIQQMQQGHEQRELDGFCNRFATVKLYNSGATFKEPVVQVE